LRQPGGGGVRLLDLFGVGEFAEIHLGEIVGPRGAFHAPLPVEVAVGAVGHDGRRAEFSNFGWWVDVCTGGVDIFGAFPRYPDPPDPQAVPPFFDGWAIWNGTSFAAPKVAGEIAARLSTRRYRTARSAASSLVNDAGRPHLPGLGTLLDL